VKNEVTFECSMLHENFELHLLFTFFAQSMSFNEPVSVEYRMYMGYVLYNSLIWQY